jgi:hypothetical protein
LPKVEDTQPKEVNDLKARELIIKQKKKLQLLEMQIMVVQT